MLCVSRAFFLTCHSCHAMTFASLRLFTCLVYVSTYCVPIAHLRQNKPFSLLYLGYAQIKRHLTQSITLFYYPNYIYMEPKELPRIAFFLGRKSYEKMCCQWCPFQKLHFNVWDSPGDDTGAFAVSLIH